MTDWYEENIEEGIRDVVKALRDNGINTTCSCEHEMWIEAETYDPSSELNTIFNVLVEKNIHEWTAKIIAEAHGHYNKEDYYTGTLGIYHTYILIEIHDKPGGRKHKQKFISIGDAVGVSTTNV